MSKPILVLGLSGGVDSAVAALLLKKDFDVHCVWLDIGLGGYDIAASVADWLEMPFTAADIRGELETQVCAPFVAEYQAGRTPLPCARCNPLVKFPPLLTHAEALGGKHIATGHYARTGVNQQGRTVLRKGLPANDQSYMLARLTQPLMRAIHFPLGDYEKHQVRAMAAEFDVPVAKRPDSMEICFVPSGDYATWMEERGPTPPPGNFVDVHGNVLGQHKGIHHYTLGQGRGLGISGPHRYFVSALRGEDNTVVLSDGTDLGATQVYATDPNWIGLENLTGEVPVTVRLRHSKNETNGVIFPHGDGVGIRLDTPARAPTPGQLAVFYQDDVVMGSAWIAGRDLPSAP